MFWTICSVNSLWVVGSLQHSVSNEEQSLCGSIRRSELKHTVIKGDAEGDLVSFVGNRQGYLSLTWQQMSAIWKEDYSNSMLTNGKLSSVRNTLSRATRPGIVVRSTPRPVTRPQESNRAHSGALCVRTVDFCPGGHGERAKSRERGGETHLEGH